MKIIRNNMLWIQYFHCGFGATNLLAVGSLEEYMSEIRMLPHSVVIKTANGGEIIATRAGKFMGDYGIETISFETLIVPGLKNNLLSVSKLIQKNLTVVFSKEKVTIKGKNVYVECEKGHFNLVLLQLNPVTENTKHTIACQEFGEIITTSETSLWHRRLGHLNRRGLQVPIYRSVRKNVHAALKIKPRDYLSRKMKNPLSPLENFYIQ
ncbi:hypothetical protein PR048_006377, partial [Dryococelus australis]